MRVHFKFALVASITCLAMASKSPAEELQRATPETIAKYQEIFKKLEKDYAAIHGKAVAKQQRFDNAKTRISLWVHPFEFARIPGMKRVDQLGSELLGLHDEILRRMPRNVLGNNATRFFYVIGPKDDGSFALQRTEELTKKNLRQLSESTLRVDECPYSAYEMRLSEILADPQWKVYEPTEFEVDGRKLIRLRLGVGAEGSTVSTAVKGTHSCCITVLLDPELNHAVRAWSHVLTSDKLKEIKNHDSVTIDYEKNPKGPSIPKTLTWEFYRGDEQAPIQHLAGGEDVRAVLFGRNIITIERFDFEAKPAEYFELKAFGLADILPPLRKPGDPPPPPILRRR